MQPVLTPEQMRSADRAAIEQYGIPSLILMENAARSAAEIIRRLYPTARRIVILCGNGNNGGDGYALARHLLGSADISIVSCSPNERKTEETAVNARACELLGIPIIPWDTDPRSVETLSEAELIVDALLGVGAHGAPREPIASLIEHANQCSAWKVALDVPSGLDAGTGQAYTPCFRAHCTITMGALKTGLFLGDAPLVVGQIEVAHIGVPQALIAEGAKTWLLNPDDLVQSYRRRLKRTTKFDYGRVLIIAGSEGMPGAAALCANAAVAAGAGLVELVTPRIHTALIPEVMPYCYPRSCFDNDALPLIHERMQRATVVAIGPGLGADRSTITMVQELLNNSRGTQRIVLDADALRAIDPTSNLSGITLTPHRGEFARLLNRSHQQLGTEIFDHVQRFARQTGATVVLKDFPIQICDGHQRYWLAQYNPSLASGGTGDVLTGIIAALWAQGYSQWDAAWMGVMLHANAGAIASEQHGELATRASHLIEALSVVSRTLSTVQ